MIRRRGWRSAGWSAGQNGRAALGKGKNIQNSRSGSFNTTGSTTTIFRLPCREIIQAANGR
jgi:hypothetical protein